jgi:hypothetical protein
MQEYLRRLAALQADAFAPFEAAYAGTFEVKDAIVPWAIYESELSGKPREDASNSLWHAAAAVCVAARAKGVQCLGTAPQHQRRGAFVVAPENIAPRVYAGPERLPQYPAEPWTVQKLEMTAF